MGKNVVQAAAALVTLGLLLVFQNCGRGFKAADFGSRLGLSAPKSFSLVPTYNELQEKIFGPRCVTCHSAGGAGVAALDMSSLDTILASPRAVVLGSPESSTLYIRVADGSMPQTPPRLDADEVLAISNWIAAYAPRGSAPTGPARPGDIPADPSNLHLLTLGKSEAALGWDDNSSNEESFVLERSENGGAFTPFLSTKTSVSSVSVTGLQPGTRYTFRVLARNANGTSGYSNTLDVLAPASLPVSPPPNTVDPKATGDAAPTNFRLIYANSDSALFAWDDNSNNEIGFQVEIFKSPTDLTTRFQTGALTAPNVRTAWFNSLYTADPLYARLRAEFPNGRTTFSNVIPFALLAKATAAPVTPSGFKLVSVSPNLITFHLDTLPDGTVYDAYRAASPTGPFFTVGARLAGGASDTFSVEAEPETQYYFRMVARNNNGSSPPTPVLAVKTPANSVTAPAAPSNLLALATSTQTIRLFWTDNSSDEYGFFVERSLDGANYSIVYTASPGEVSMTDRNLTAGTTYSYRVRAYNMIGSSSYSNVSSAVWTNYPPARPTSLTAVSVTDTTALLSFIGNSSFETGFVMERSLDGVNFTASAAFDPNTPSYYVTGLTPNTTYYFRAKAVMGAQSSPYSDVVSVKTLAALPPPGQTTPAAPSDLTGTATYPSTMVLNWKDNSQDETGFVVEQSTDGVNFTPYFATFPPNTTTATIGRALPVVPLYFRVYAQNTASKKSSPSNIVRVDGYSPDGRPATPGLSLTPISPTAISLFINDWSTNEDGFYVEMSSNGNTYQRVATLAANTGGYHLTGLTPGARVSIRVLAFNAKGASAPGYDVFGQFWIATPAPATDIPFAPENLRYSSANSKSVLLNWNDVSSDETGFEVEQSNDGRTWMKVAALPRNINSTLIGGLSSFTPYLFRVRALNGAGSSVSATLSLVTNDFTPDIAAPPAGPVPADPSGVTANATSSTTAALAWTLSSNDATSFEVYTWYNGTEKAWTRNYPAGSARSFNLTGLVPNKDYYVTIRAINASGSSDPSTFVSFRTPP